MIKKKKKKKKEKKKNRSKDLDCYLKYCYECDVPYQTIWLI